MNNPMYSLEKIYTSERDRLRSLASLDQPQGEYSAPVFGVGKAHADVMLIGEAPGAEETKSACPFVGKAGKQLDQLLEAASINRSDLFITNVVKYRPVVRGEKTVRNRTPSKKEIDAALPLLKQEIGLVRPRLIVTLGNTPLHAILLIAQCGKRTIGDVHGRLLPITIDDLQFNLVALYHPASCIYNRSLLPILEEDARMLGEHLVKALQTVEKV